MFEYIDSLKQKPGHVRERIAFGAAAGITVFVAAGWLAVMTTGDALRLNPGTLAEDQSVSNFSDTFAQAGTNFNALLGAVGAANGGTASGITVETKSSTTVGQKEQTTIPF